MYDFIMDRYHAVMGDFFIGQHASLLGDREAVFYISQRKGIGPVLGHSQLRKSLVNSQIDAPHVRFLKEDRANLGPLAGKLAEEGSFLGEIRLVPEGTIIFPNEPFGDIKGPLWNIQLHEVKFQHAFDLPMTVGNRALKIRRAAGKEPFLSVFSLRRDGDSERSLKVSEAAYICGFDDTSDMDAAFTLGIPSVGTMAHYLVQSFAECRYAREFGEMAGKVKHFERIAFEKWLDANPKGTILLIDTIDYKTGIVHAIQAALSSPQRKDAFKGIRIDSGDLIESSKHCRKLLDLNGLQKAGIILTGDLEEKKIGEIRNALDFPIHGYGIGTKLAAEVEKVAGVIFKMCLINNFPTMKLSGSPGKETLPGELQVWRCCDSSGNYVKDVISLIEEPAPSENEINSVWPLLEPFWGKNVSLYQTKSPERLKKHVEYQLKKFTVPLEKYPVEISRKLSELKKKVSECMKDDKIYKEIKTE